MDFRRIRDDQELLVEYKDFPGLVCTLLQSLNDPKSANKGLLETLSESKSVFTVQQAVSKKEFDLLVLEAYREDEEALRQMVAYRYGVLRAQIDKMEGRAIDIREMLRLKSPHLLATFDSF